MNNTNNNNFSNNDILSVLAWLRENFSLAFPHKAHEVKPLSLGIMEEILEFYNRLDTPPFSKKKLRAALAYYTMSPVYLKTQQIGKPRIDLYGNEVEVVTTEQADYAKRKYDERYNKQVDKNTEER